MKRVLKKFSSRGLLFMGFGPLIYAIVLLTIEWGGEEIIFSGISIFKGVLSTSLLAFLASGVSIVWQEEKIGKGAAVLIQGTTLYISYLLTYLINDWIKKDLPSILIFTAVFVGTYIIIWLIIYLVEKNRAKELNKQLK